MPEKLRIGIVADWKRCARGNLWPALLDRISDEVPNEHTIYPIGDLLLLPLETSDPASISRIKDEHVLIVNWDAANGDPSFGAHLTLQWLAHRRPEILAWVRKGNILIVESQTVLGAPSQAAYDAAIGSGELLVCGYEDRADPLQQDARNGGRCERTRSYPRTEAFNRVRNPIEVVTAPTHHDMFPDGSDKPILVDIKDAIYKDILYRGWFRKTLLRQRDLPWVSILQTQPNGSADRRQTRWSQSTMQVARLGDGAIFATTMLLAATGQAALVKAMLQCAKRQTAQLPSPTPLSGQLQKWWKAGAALTTGTAVLFLTNLLTPWIQKLSGAVGVGPGLLDPKSVASIAYSAVASGALFGMVYQGYLFARRAVRNFVGY